jgi:Uma2 family endonuclease
MLDDLLPATSVYTPLEEYLSTTYRPDCDYIDGEVKERDWGEKPHGRLQGYFARYIGNRRQEWRVEAIPELRVQVAERRYRTPDICVVSDDAPDEDIIRTPPVLCIEILSRKDSMSESLDRVDDYLHMGVPTVWILDPWKRRAHSVIGNGTLHLETEFLRVPNTEIIVPVAEVFAELNPRNS